MLLPARYTASARGPMRTPVGVQKATTDRRARTGPHSGHPAGEKRFALGHGGDAPDLNCETAPGLNRRNPLFTPPVCGSDARLTTSRSPPFSSAARARPRVTFGYRHAAGPRRGGFCGISICLHGPPLGPAEARVTAALRFLGN